jgi:putative drug exporter of the RND superfamily
MLTRLAQFSYRRRRYVVAAWIAVIVTVNLVAAGIGGEHRANYLMPGSESEQVAELLDERFPERSGDAIYVVARAESSVTEGDSAVRVEALRAELASLEHVVAVEPSGVSPDATTAITTVQLDDRSERLELAALREMVHTITDASDGTVTFEAGGYPVQMAEGSESSSEGIGMIAALLILLVAFGSVVAAGLPLAIAIPGLGVGLGLVPLLNRVLEVPEWAVPLATMIGIGVGIDYALFIVTRYRSALADGHDPQAAVTMAMTTSGRAVLFAGGTVAIAIVGLGTMGLAYMWGFVAAMVATLVGVMAATMTLLPALLGFAGRNLDRLRVPFFGRNAERAGIWVRWSRLVQRRPLVLGAVALVVLVALAVPAVNLRFGYPDGGTESESATSRRAYDLVSESFGAGANGPLVVAVDTAALDDPTVTDAMVEALGRTDGVAAVLPPQTNEAGDATVVTVIPETGPQHEETEALVHRLRDEVVPAAAGPSADSFVVGGMTAAHVDESDYLGRRIPVFIVTVIALSFLLLMAVFRSVLVALKAAIMNLLSIGAAYGVVSLAVNGSWLGEAIGIHQATPIPVWMPIMMFALLFGLSMDYEVFLLSRIREEYLRTGDNALSVAEGIARTGRVITAAALIMVTVFSTLMLNGDVISKVAGLGLATAILVDATVVRMVLVPSTMELLGDRNWWMPRWLDRVLPRIDVDGEPVPVATPAPVGAPTRSDQPVDEPVPVLVGGGR